jgi:hypothetical protein
MDTFRAVKDLKKSLKSVQLQLSRVYSVIRNQHGEIVKLRSGIEGIVLDLPDGKSSHQQVP